MIKRLNMNMELLNLIILVQQYKKYKQDEIRLLGNLNNEDVEEYTKEYYNSLPNELLAQYNLSKNNTSFDKVIKYPITETILQTEDHELNRFEF